MSYDRPSETRVRDYTTRHQSWEFDHQWGPSIGDRTKYRVEVSGKRVAIRDDGKASLNLPAAVARSLATAVLAACNAIEVEDDDE